MILNDEIIIDKPLSEEAKFLEHCGLSTSNDNTPKYRKIKDWSDYVLVTEKIISEGEDMVNGIRYNLIEIYYNVHDRPFPGNGYFFATNENIKEKTLKEYLDENVFNKYKNNPYIRVENIYKV